MLRWFLIPFIILLFSGCATHHVSRKGIISRELPLTLDDLAEIREGEKNYEKVLWEYHLYENPKLQKYCNAIAASIAEVSTRPHLPYRVVLLDTDEVNIFGGAGGYVYATRGLFHFVESESELAGMIAHEITHVANYEYAGLPQFAGVKKVYGYMLRGSEIAKGNGAGIYGTAANFGLQGIGKAAPVIMHHFSSDQEVLTDERAVDSLVKAGYDPQGIYRVIERLARVPMNEVGRFVNLLNTHPPFEARRNVLRDRIRRLDLEKGKL